MFTSVLSARSAAISMSRSRSPSPGTATSSPGKAGLPGAVLDEAAHPGTGVLGSEHAGEMQPLDLQSGAQVDLQPLVDGLLGSPQGQGGPGGVAGGKGGGGGQHVVVRDDLVNEADPERLGRVDEPAGEHDVLGPGRADQAGQPLGAAGAGDQAEQDLGLAEAGALPGDPEVGAQGELQAAAEGVAGDRGDDRLADPGHGGERVLQRPG